MQPLEVGVASSGFQLMLNDGVTCEVMNKPHQKLVKFLCDPNKEVTLTHFVPAKSYEGNSQLFH